MDITLLDFIDLVTRHRDELDAFLKKLANVTAKRRFTVPDNLFDAEKFKARYSLVDSDFTTISLNGQLYVTMLTDAPIVDNPPIFEAPAVPQTTEALAQDLVQRLLAKESTEEELTKALLQFVSQARKEG